MTIQKCLEMAGKFLHTLVIILLVSQLIFSKATSASRTGVNLLYNSQDTLSSDHNAQLQKITKRGAGRENLEFNDYSNTGANGRHTPEPPTVMGGIIKLSQLNDCTVELRREKGLFCSAPSGKVKFFM